MPSTSSEETAALANTTVVVHPLVLLSIVDHAARAAKGSNKRVVGVLLGQTPFASAALPSSSGAKIVNVANSFAVPFEEDEKNEKTWFLDHNYVDTMAEMFKKVNAKERLIGWYHSGPKLRKSDLEINEMMKRFCPKPVMVIVDVRDRDIGIPTDAYVSVEEIKDDGTTTQKTFMHVPSTIEAEEAEEIGVEHLLRDVKDTVTGTLSNRISNQLAALKGLQTRLGEMNDYLEAVHSGSLPVNHGIIYNLQDIFNLLPRLESGGKEVQGAFSVAANDQALMVYMGNLIRTVIALHSLVDNKLTNLKAVEDDKLAAEKDIEAKDKEAKTEAGEKKAESKVEDKA